MTSDPDKTETEERQGGEREPFLSRWSRRKQVARQQVRAPDTNAADSKAPAPSLPPVEKLTLESDFRGFFHPKVSEDLRRAALKKLFSDPHFNVMDGLDVYIEDYSRSEPIPAAMLAGLKQAQRILEWAKEDKDEHAGERRPELTPAHTLGPPAGEAESGAELPSASVETAPASPADAHGVTKS